MLHRVVGPRGYFVTGTLRLTSAIKPTPTWRCLKRSVGTESTSTALSARFGSGELKDFIKDADKARAAPPDPAEAAPYLDVNALRGDGRHVYFETYGCQMNVADTEIAWAVLENAGFGRAQDVGSADIALMVTCAIREGAEQRVFNRLQAWHDVKRKRGRSGSPQADPLKVGVLGCMAERLKSRLLEEGHGVDLVCGPDAYRDLPRLLAHTRGADQTAINVQLSLDETYADIAPVRLDPSSPSAFVSIMRGCDNMCTYCIVPFTRGRERSRDLESIVAEVEALSMQGVKEVTLLGQNVNSYLDRAQGRPREQTPRADGFTTVYKPKEGSRRFAELLKAVAEVDPTMRVRFTSPHPKDFADEVLEVIRDYQNVCSSIHLPAQSGSNTVLKRMGRGYTREAYLALVERIRNYVPNVTLSSDFIAGFCGETDQDHLDTLDLMQRVRFDSAFLFAYSMREKTRAYHRLEDDVSGDVKQARLQELIQVFHEGATAANAERIGTTQTVLVEGASKRSELDLVGRIDGNIKLVFPSGLVTAMNGGSPRIPVVGDLVNVVVESGTSKTLRGVPVSIMP